MNQTKNTPLVISSRKAREKKVPLIGSSQSNIRNRTNQSPRRSGVRVRQTNNGCGQAYFFLPSPSPSPILNPSTSPLKSVFDSSQLSGSINVQDGGTTLFLKNNSWIALQNTPALQAILCLEFSFHDSSYYTAFSLSPHSSVLLQTKREKMINSKNYTAPWNKIMVRKMVTFLFLPFLWPL